MVARVLKFPTCCRKRMVFQPARIRWYCKHCGKLMPHREPLAPEPAPTLITDDWGNHWSQG